MSNMMGSYYMGLKAMHAMSVVILVDCRCSEVTDANYCTNFAI